MKKNIFKNQKICYYLKFDSCKLTKAHKPLQNKSLWTFYFSKKMRTTCVICMLIKFF